MKAVLIGTGGITGNFIDGKDIDLICMPEAAEYLIEISEEYKMNPLLIKQTTDYTSMKITIKDQFNEPLNIELHNMFFLNNVEVLKRAQHNGVFIRHGSMPSLLAYLPSPFLMYAIKRSHAHRPLKFAKTMNDLATLKKMMGENAIPNEDKKILVERIQMTKDYFGDKTPSLYKTNEEFFEDGVRKIYVHDDLHEIMAFNDTPVYKMMKRDFALAKCEKDMWSQLDQKLKIQAVQEEAMVIALERFLIPKKIVSPRVAYLKALEKICTTLTSGWFRDFAIDFYEDVCYNPTNYLKIFEERKNECRKY